MTLVQLTPRVGLSSKRSLYQDTVRDPAQAKPRAGLFVLRHAAENDKLGGDSRQTTILIRKGPEPFRNTVFFQLSLEEGATCPSTCPYLEQRVKQDGTASKRFWCYGSNMPWARRWQAGDALLMRLRQDLDTLSFRQLRYARYAAGFTVRTHVLGDFYSVEYARFWGEMLALHGGLRVYGYTHWPQGTPVGDTLSALVREFPDRLAIRRSDGEAGDPLPGAVDLGRGEVVPAGVVPCPSQTHGVPCVDCGLCFNNFTTIGFTRH
jgi:hypothetical protein